jgi:hypothetical protein
MITGSASQDYRGRRYNLGISALSAYSLTNSGPLLILRHPEMVRLSKVTDLAA